MLAAVLKEVDKLVLEDGLPVEAASGLPCAGDEGITLSPRSTA